MAQEPNLDEIGDEDLTVFSTAAPSAPVVDYVFLHGLNGHPRRTWTHKNGFYWPTQILQDIPGARVMIYGYNADFEWALVHNKTTIKAIAQKFVNRLIDKREGELMDRPLVMVAHSLGGLIIKQALVNIHKDRSSGRSGRMIDEQNAIYDSVAGLVFMGTPHAGCHVEELTRIKTLKLLAKAISISYPDKLVKTLSAQSDGLLDLSEDFEKTTIFIKHEIEICTYYETKTTFLLGSEEVVPLSAARLHYENERKEGIAATHSGMVKFPKAKDGMYCSIMKRLASMGSDGLKVREARRVLDRFSINIEDVSTASVLEAVTRSADTLRACQRHLARFHMADLSIASLHTECSNIRFQLNRIQNLILRNGDRFESYVMEEYQSLLEACSISFFVLNRHFEALGLTMVGKMTQQTVVEQVKLLWEHRQMEIVSHSIIGQARAIGVLFNAFASESPIRASEIMQSHEARHVLESVSNDVMSLHESFHTALTAMDEMESITGSILGDEATELDTILINTTLYKKAFKGRIKAQKEAIRENADASFVTVPDAAFEAGPSGTNRAESASALLQEDITDSLPRTDTTDQTSIHSRESVDTVRPAPATEDNDWNSTPRLATVDFAQPGTRRDEIAANTEPDRPRYKSPELPPPAYLKYNRQPTLFEVLSRRTLKPYSLFEFYIYMRDMQKALDYLDFWLDIAQHMNLCRHYVRELRRSVIISTPPLEDGLSADLELNDTSSLAARSSMPGTREKTGQDAVLSAFLKVTKEEDDTYSNNASSSVRHVVLRQDIRASAEKILYTYLLPGSEREVMLPHSITNEIAKEIEESGRDDPEVFDAAKDYVFQAMERDAFPGFLNLSRPLFRVFRGSKTLGTLVNRLSRKDGYVPVPSIYGDRGGLARIPPEQLFGSLGDGRSGTRL